MGVDFRPLETEERNRLADALRRNATDGAALRLNPLDTSWVPGEATVTDDEVIAAIRSVPCHYAEITLPRSGQAPLVFVGEMLAESDGERVSGREQNRWHELAVYRTPGGKFVVRIAYRTRWQGELEHNAAEVCQQPREVATVLRDHNPTAAVVGYPTGSGYKDKQARLMADIRGRYEEQISEILASAPEFAERID